ncbi:hypothetical protein, partial [Humibacter antri]
RTPPAHTGSLTNQPPVREQGSTSVLLVSSFPYAVRPSELDTALDSLASARERDLPPGAVVAALKVLDDAFLASHKDKYAGAVSVSVTNPSVSDFAASWLREHPHDALLLISSVKYFEQLDWIRVEIVLTAAPATRTVLESALREAVMRCFPVEPVLGERFRPNRSATYFWRISPEVRLQFAMAVGRELKSQDANYDSWLALVRQAARQRWQDGEVGDLEAALELLAGDSDRNEDVTAAANALVHAATTASDWRAIADCLQDEPELITVPMREIAELFDGWATEELRAPDGIADEDAFGELEALAEGLGVSHSDLLWQEAYDAIRARFDAEETYVPQHPDANVAQPDASRIDALFAHFDSL